MTVPRASPRPLLVLSAWAVMLVISDLPEIVLSVWARATPAWLPWVKLGFVAAFLLVSMAWQRIRPLWQYGSMLLVLQLALRAQSWVQSMAWWQRTFTGSQASFSLAYAGVFITDVGVALAVIALLWLVKRRRAEFFLAKGDLTAPVEPVRWLGIGKGGSWRTFGWIFAVAASIAVIIPTILGVKLSPALIFRVAPLLPAVILFATVNAFTEEMCFRASFLSTLYGVIGRPHTLLITIVFFGLAHFLYGSPPGLLGALMTGLLAFLLGKAMLETKGLTWPWLIHFLPDVVVFASYALLWVSA